MTGWRLGYGVMNRKLAEQITKLMVNSNSCTAAFTQKAGVAALRGDQAGVTQMRATFRRRRDRVVELLNDIDGINCRTPRGAFYVFPNTRKLGINTAATARYLLEDAGVALLSGTAFGRFGEGYLRLSYATSTALLEEGVAKITEAAAHLRASH